MAWITRLGENPADCSLALLETERSRKTLVVRISTYALYKGDLRLLSISPAF